MAGKCSVVVLGLVLSRLLTDMRQLRVLLGILAVSVVALMPAASWHHLLFAHESHEHTISQHGAADEVAIEGSGEEIEHVCHVCAHFQNASMLHAAPHATSIHLESSQSFALTCAAPPVPSESPIRNKSPPLV